MIAQHSKTGALKAAGTANLQSVVRSCASAPLRQQLRQQPPRIALAAAATAAEGGAAAAQALRKEPSPRALEFWRSAQAVCFDVDSTFCEDESIDEIAAFLGVGDKVAALTAQAMGGSVKFEDALAARLSLMAPTRARLGEFLAAHPARVSPGIPELVAALRGRGCEVFLVSGGFRAVIHPIAESLGIPLTNVFANQILFDADGAYAGFDPSEFTSRSGGKAAAIREIRRARGFERVVMVGDGATDLEARAPDAAGLFVGYGGVVERPNIAAAADWYVYRIPELTAALR